MTANEARKVKVYRVEDQVGRHGLWRDFDGTVNPLFGKLTIGKCKDMPMEDSDFYRQDGKQWFAATDAPEKLLAWFDVLDIVESEKIGYFVYEFEVENIREVSEYEVVFTRDSIRSCRRLDPQMIWNDYNEVKIGGSKK